MKEIKYTRFAIALYCGMWLEVQNVRDTRAVFRAASRICKRENTRIKLIETEYPDGRETYWRNHYTSGSRSRAIDCTPFKRESRCNKMKVNPYTPAHHIPRISETRRYPFAHLHGIEEMLNTEIEWLNADRQSHRLFNLYYDTDLAIAMYKSVCLDLEYINVDLAIYSYIVEGWC